MTDRIVYEAYPGQFDEMKDALARAGAETKMPDTHEARPAVDLSATQGCTSNGVASSDSGALIVEGWVYTSRDGRRFGPMIWDAKLGLWRDKIHPKPGDYWHENGSRYGYCDDGMDLIRATSAAQPAQRVTCEEGHNCPNGPHGTCCGCAEEPAAQDAQEDLAATGARLFAIWDKWIGGEPGSDAESARALLLAASFAAQAFEDAAAAPMSYDGAPGQLLRAFLLALADPSHPDLDYLRACNRPEPEPAGEDGAEVERLRAQLAEMSQRYTSACGIIDKIATERDALKAEVERLRDGAHQFEILMALLAGAGFEEFSARTMQSYRATIGASLRAEQEGEKTR